VARNRLTDAAHPEIEIGLLVVVAVDRASAVAATGRCEDTSR